MSLRSVLERRFVVVTGKGGVGRTTVAAALGVVAGRQGKRVAVVEMSGAREVAEVFGLQGRSYRPRRAARGVDTFSLTPRECLDDFGTRKLKLGMFAKRIVNNRVTRSFFEAVPGLHDLQQLGKIENLLSDPLRDDPKYDLIILDAPATGHGLTLLSSARSMREMTRVGPFAELARIIEEFLADAQRTSLVLTTLPEALPVQESLELTASLKRDGAQLSGVVVNQVRAPVLPPSPSWAAVRPSLVAAGGAFEQLAWLADRSEHVLEEQREVLEALTARLTDTPVFRAPRVLAPDPRSRALGVADALEAAL